MRSFVLLAVVLLGTSPAPADLRVLDLYRQYTFQWSDYADWPHMDDCERYIADALERLNIQRPFCELDDIGRFIEAGWKVEYAEDISYQVKPTPQMHRWECRLFRVDCIGTRFYLSRP